MNGTRAIQQQRTTYARLWIHMVMVGLLLLTGCAAPAGAASLEDAFPEDGPAPPVSRAAALNFVRKALTAGERATQTKTLTFSITDAEITSFLNIRAELTEELERVGIDQFEQMEGLEDLAPEDVDVETLRRLLNSGRNNQGRRLPRLRPGLREPAVYFRNDGQIIARGYLTLLLWRQPVRVVLAPYAADGELEFDFVEGHLGTTAMPEVVFDLIGRGLAQALMAGHEYAEITQISVTQGQFTLSGRYRR